MKDYQQTKELYRNAYPDFIALFWCYVRLRTPNGGLLTAQEKLDKSFVLRSSDLSLDLASILESSLQKLVVEFYFLVTGNDTYPGGYNRNKYIPVELEQKYSEFFSAGIVQSTVRLVEHYLANNATKLSLHPESPGRARADWKAQAFENLEGGTNTASSILGWAGLLKHGLGDNFDIKRFLYKSARVDVEELSEHFDSIGVTGGVNFAARNIEDLDPAEKSLLNTKVISSHTTPTTIGCPAMFPPSNQIAEHIQTHWPELNGNETMIEGLARVIPKEITRLFNEIVEVNGEQSLEVMLLRQDEIMRELWLNHRLQSTRIAELNEIK